MGLSIVGVDHKSCHVSVREPLTLTGQSLTDELDRLIAHPSIEEAVVLSTCARTELYLWSSSEDEAVAQEEARRSLVGRSPHAAGHIQVRSAKTAVLHAFRVVAGLESQIIGEFEIAGQVRGSLAHARSRDALGPHLEALFRAATVCSRRLRRETNLGATDASVAQAAATIYGLEHDIRAASVLIIGSGRIARMLAATIREAKRTCITGRTHQAAATVAAAEGIELLHFAEAMGRLPEFDLILCATRTRHPILTRQQLAGAAPVVVMDLAIPRNVEADASTVPGVTLYDVDAIRPTTGASSPDSALMDSIVESEVHDFLGRDSIAQVAPIIAALREHVDAVRDEELQRLRGRLDTMPAEHRAVVETLTHRLIDRMFHHLVVRLKLAALSDPELIRAAMFFFAHGEDSIFPELELVREDAESEASPVATPSAASPTPTE